MFETAENKGDGADDARARSLLEDPPRMTKEAAARSAEQHRARFDALRRKIFGEMARGAARWRLAWIVPFFVAVLLLLIARGAQPWRVFVQGAAIATVAVLAIVKAYRPGPATGARGIFFGMTATFAGIAVTGGLASPLMITSTMVLLGASMMMPEPKWIKRAVFAYHALAMIALAIVSRTPLGELTGPLVPEGGWSSAEYVTIAAASAIFVAVGNYNWGCTLSRAYEQVAFELAERREEICEETEDRTRAIEGMAARLAHEVKNPLAAIKGLSVHMSRNAADAKTAERLAIVAAEADRLQAIVDGFLSFSRGLDDLKLGLTKPHEIARELVTLLETRAEESGVELKVIGGADIVVNSDGRKLRQAMLNLVLNAIQASRRGGAVSIDVARGGVCSGVKVRVADEGAGMSAEILERIRKPYFTTKEGGTGLGVAVARGIIEQHGGRLSFESAIGKGTTATIELPTCSMKFAKEMLPNPFRSKDGAQDVETGVEVAGDALKA
jgi:two-component sensor histidine kinase